MADIVFASNNISHFPGTTASIVGFDSNRVPYSINTQDSQIHGGPVFTKVVGDVTWLHFRMVSQSNYFSTAILLKMIDETGQTLVNISKVHGTHNARFRLYNGTGGVSVFGDFYIGAGGYLPWDFKITVTVLGVSVVGYLNGVEILNITIGSNANNIQAPTQLILGTAGGGNGSLFSEIIISDSDTRNARLDLLRPISSGAYSGWSGLLSTLADDDPTTGMTTLSAGIRQSMQLTAYTGSANISNVVAVSTTTRGQNSPSQLNHFIRQSTVDYDGIAHDVPFEFSTEITDWPINPATSLPWISADIDTFEVGFQSLT